MKTTFETTFRRYIQQPTELPEVVGELLQKQWPGTQVLLFAMFDLDAHYELTEGWWILTHSHLVEARKNLSADRWTVSAIDLKRTETLYELAGLSCNRLKVIERDTHLTICECRYTHRQSRAFGLIKTAIEQMIQGDPPLHFKSSAESLYQRQMVQPIEDAQMSLSAKKSDVVWRLLTYLKPYRRDVVIGMLGAACMTAVSLIPAYVSGRIIDSVIRPFQEGRLTANIAMAQGWRFIIALVGAYFVRELFAYVRLKKMSKLGEYVARDLRDAVYSHLQNLSVQFFGSKQTGSLISRVSSDTDRIWDFIAFGVVEVTTSVLMLTGLSVVLLMLDWRLGLIVTVPVPLLLYAIYRHGLRMQQLFVRAWRRWSNLTEVLSDTIPGIRVVKAFHREKYEIDRFRLRNQEALETFNGIHDVWTRFWPILMVMIHGILILVWSIGLPRVLQYELSPGTLVSFILYLTMFVQPIEIIGQMSRMINRATSSAQRVFEVLDTQPTILKSESPIQLKRINGDIEFESVTFSYDGVRKILDNISFRVAAGEMIGLVGPSGSGKSTIINLLARFFEPTQGRIRVDGHDIKQLSDESYRSQLGMVLQEPYLFHGSILQNIRYGRPEASLSEVIDAARAANVHDFVCRLPHGYDTIVGERGHTLSGGERQRVSIARAILRDPRIIILDEATSAVDTETERQIQEALDRLVSGRTVIAIAHRLSTLAHADRILVMKQGRLVECGTHHELMGAIDGVYRRLVDLQTEMQLMKKEVEV